ncbi:MAG: efflux RND transporter permease subunit [Blastocatellia bacterium]
MPRSRHDDITSDIRLLPPLIGVVVRRPWLVILATALITLALGAGLRHGLELDVSPITFIEKSSQQRADYQNTRESFGDDQYLLIALSCDDVFKPENIARLRELTRRMEATPGTVEVLSLVNVPYARARADGASLETLVPPGAAADRLAEARRVAATDRLYRGHFVSPDARHTAISVLIDQTLPTDRRHDITRQMYELAKTSGFPEAYLAGDPISQWSGTEAIKRDLKIFLPLTLLLIAVLLWHCFRSWAAVLFPLLGIGIGLVWLLGMMAWLGMHFTVIALMLPTLMLAIGCSYMIHVLNQIGIEQMRDGESGMGEAASQAAPVNGAGPSTIRHPQAAMERALRFISVPVIVSALTIMAGFLSLSFTGIQAVREAAVLSATGAGFTMFLSLTFLPAMMVVGQRFGGHIRTGLDGGLTRLLEATGKWVVTRQLLLYAVTALIIVFSLVGITRIYIDIDYYRFFRPEAETSVALTEVGRRLAGAVGFEVIVEGSADGGVETPETLNRIIALQQWMEGSGLRMDHTLAVTDFLRHLNRGFHNGDAGYDTVPDDPAVIREFLSDRQKLSRFITADGRRARILVRSTLAGSARMSAAIREVEAKGRELLPGQRVFATGTLVLLNRTSDHIGLDQRNSLTLALVTIIIVLTILFRSWRMGLTALIPNLIPVLFFFGFMGWRGIPLNLTTSLVASVVLGLAVDNAVQFIVRYRHVRPRSATSHEAIVESMRLSGRPIIYANVALAASFAVFAISTFEPIESFGLLSAVTIMGCLVEDLVLLPARMTAPIFDEQTRKEKP